MHNPDDIFLQGFFFGVLAAIASSFAIVITSYCVLKHSEDAALKRLKEETKNAHL